jgi:hypothetical protein
MGNFHSYYGVMSPDTGGIIISANKQPEQSTSTVNSTVNSTPAPFPGVAIGTPQFKLSAENPGHNSHSQWLHCLDQRMLKSVFVNHNEKIVSNIHPSLKHFAQKKGAAGPHSSGTDDLEFNTNQYCDLPSFNYSYAIQSEIVQLLNQSNLPATPQTNTNLSGFFKFLDSMNSRLYREMADIIYNNIIVNNVNCVKTLDSIDPHWNKQSKSAPIALKAIQSKVLGKVGKKILNNSVLEIIEKTVQGVLINTAEDKFVREFYAQLLQFSLDANSLSKEELEKLIKISLLLAIRTQSAVNMQFSLVILLNIKKFYHHSATGGELKLNLFSFLAKFSQEINSLIGQIMNNNSNNNMAETQQWKSVIAGRNDLKLSAASGNLYQNDNASVRSANYEKDGLSISHIITFILANLAVTAETSVKFIYSTPISSSSSINNAQLLLNTANVANYLSNPAGSSLFSINLPLQLEFKPFSLQLLAEILANVVQLRVEHHLPVQYKAVYNYIKHLGAQNCAISALSGQNFGGLLSPISSNNNSPRSVSTVSLNSQNLAAPVSSLGATSSVSAIEQSRLLLSIVRSLSEGEAKYRRIRFAPDLQLLELLGFSKQEISLNSGVISTGISTEAQSPSHSLSQSATSATEPWLVLSDNAVNLNLLRYAYRHLHRFHTQNYSSSNNQPNKLAVEEFDENNSDSNAILHALGLIRVFLLVGHRNRFATELYSPAAGNSNTVWRSLVNSLLQIINSEENEYSEAEAGRLIERERAYQCIVLAFKHLSTALQIKVMDRALVHTGLRAQLLQLIQISPAVLSLIPSPAQLGLPSSQASSIWEKLFQSQDRSIHAALVDRYVVNSLISLHSEGQFHMPSGELLTILRSYLPMRAVLDLLAKPVDTKENASSALTLPASPALEHSVSAPPDSLGAPVTPNSTNFFPATTSLTPSMAPITPNRPSVAPSVSSLASALNSFSENEEKKELSGSSIALPPSTPDFYRQDSSAGGVLPSPPLMGQRGASAFPPLEHVEVPEQSRIIDALLDQAYSLDCGLILQTIQRNLFSSILVPIHSSDRSYAAVTLSQYSKLLISHINYTIQSLQHNSGNPANFYAEFHSTIYAALLPSLLIGLSYLASLSAIYFPIDESLLASLHSLFSNLGGYEIPNISEENLDVATQDATLDGSDPLAYYSFIYERMLSSSVYIDYLHENEAALQNEIKRRNKNHLLPLLGKLKQESQSLQKAPLELLQIFDSLVFNNNENRGDLLLQHVLNPAFFVCALCGHRATTQQALLTHSLSTSHCKSLPHYFSIVRQSLLFTVIKCSKALVSAKPVDSGRSNSAAPIKQFPNPHQPETLPANNTNNSVVPRTAAAWLNSDLMRSGFEDSYLHAPLSSLFPSTASTQVSAQNSPARRAVLNGNLQFNAPGIFDKAAEETAGNKEGLTEREDSLKVVEHDSIKQNSANINQLSAYSTPQRSTSYLSLSEPYPHHNWLMDLVNGSGEAQQLDSAAMQQVSMRIYGQKRKITGAAGTKASRAVIATLLKHTNKVELAVDFAESLAQKDKTPVKVSPQLLKLWRLGNEIISDFVSLHQQSMQYLCAHRGCELETTELLTETIPENGSNSGKIRYKCAAGHITDKSIEKEKFSYEELAERVLKNCFFLLKLKSSGVVATQPSFSMMRQNSQRMKKLLKVKPHELQYSPSPSPFNGSPSTLNNGAPKFSAFPTNPPSAHDSKAPQLTAAVSLSYGVSQATPAASNLILHDAANPNDFSITLQPISPLSAPLPLKTRQRRSNSSNDLLSLKGINENEKLCESPIDPNNINNMTINVSIINEQTNSLAVQFEPTSATSQSQQPLSANSWAKRENFRLKVKREIQAAKWKELRAELLLSRPSFLSLQSIPVSSLCLSFAKGIAEESTALSETLDQAVNSAVLRAERRVRGLESLCVLLKAVPIEWKLLVLNQWQTAIHDWKYANKSATSAAQSEEKGENSLAKVQTPYPSQLSSVQRYDNNLDCCGATRLTMITDAFYRLASIVILLMDTCLTNLAINRESPDSLVLLLCCLQSWKINFHRIDFTYLRNMGLLSVINNCISNYPSISSTSTRLQVNEPVLLQIGYSCRQVFRLLVLSCLSCDPKMHSEDEDEEKVYEKSTNSETEAEAEESSEDISVDSFECMLLESIFDRLENIIDKLDASYRATGATDQKQLDFQRSPYSSSQDEHDCYELLSLLLLSCSSLRIRLSLTHSAADAAHQSASAVKGTEIVVETSEQDPNAKQPTKQSRSATQSPTISLSHRCLLLLCNLTNRVNLSLLSTRCVRRSLRLCQLLLPLLTPEAIDFIFSHSSNNTDASPVDSEAADSLPTEHNIYINHLLLELGYFGCGRFVDRDSFKSDSMRCSSLTSELVALLRVLQQAPAWSDQVNSVLTQCLQQLKHKQFLASDEPNKLNFYRCWASLCVYGGYNESLRVGARVRVGRTTRRNEKLSNEQYFYESNDDSAIFSNATVMAINTGYAMVIYENDISETIYRVSLTSCQAIDIIPCLHPIQSNNINSIVNYINSAFSLSSNSSTFALYPTNLMSSQPQQLGSPKEIDNRDQQLNYIHSLLKVQAMKALVYSISLGLHNQSNSETNKEANQTVEQLVTAILRDTSNVEAPENSKQSTNTLMSNLLSISQNVIPLASGVLTINDLSSKLYEINSLLHERELNPSVPSELRSTGVHVDLCVRSMQLFPNDYTAARQWLMRKHADIKLKDEATRRTVMTSNDAVKNLQEMGFDQSLCERALLLCNGDTNQAVNWLMDNGFQEMENIKNGKEPENWGLEGVDFYQEKGHWIASINNSATNANTNEIPAITDPYRRLALSTAYQMKQQAIRNERELAYNKVKPAVAAPLLELDDLRVGQTLRISANYVRNLLLTHDKNHGEKKHIYRWYYLTEDNNWAPLDSRDMKTLDDCYSNNISFTWIGVEEKSPSLVRLDKMCMYNEITGHGRPIKRRLIDPIINQAEYFKLRAQQAVQKEAAVAAATSPKTPPATELPLSLYETLNSAQQAQCRDLSALGFPLNWCCRALIETNWKLDQAANWIFANSSKLEAEDSKQVKKQEQYRQYQALQDKHQLEQQKLVEQKEKDSLTISVNKRENNPFLFGPTANSRSDIVNEPALDIPRLSHVAGQLGRVIEFKAKESLVLLECEDIESCDSYFVWAPLEALEWDECVVLEALPELNSRKFQGLAGLALDVASSYFILYARRAVLLIIYLLTSNNSQTMKMEFIKNMTPSVLMRIFKLSAEEFAPLTLPIYRQQIQPVGNSFQPSVTPLFNANNLYNTTHNKPPRIDIWLILNSLLHHSSPILSNSHRENLFYQLIEDVRSLLQFSSSCVRDTDTEHPYTSNCNEKQHIKIDCASHLIVTFDRRCNINQAHAALGFYADPECKQELAVFSGSSEEFSHLIISGNTFTYQFISGSLRQKPYEFGFRFRVRPIGFVYKDENQLLSHSLGWNLLVLLTDSVNIIDYIISIQNNKFGFSLVETMLRYLTVCRSPCKVMVTRALTAICNRVKPNTMSNTSFEILLRVMEQLYESNTASGWGSSPFLMSLVDLIRCRPTFKYPDAELWSIDSIDNRPPSWFFLTVLRAESLSRSILQSSRLPSIKLVERAYIDLSDIEILRWCLKQPELCLKLHKQTRNWNNYRRDWMSCINNFSTYAQAADVLVALKQSLLPECYKLLNWIAGSAGKEWEERVKKSTTAADIAKHYIELESVLKWGDAYPEADRAFGDTWASRRPDWLAAMKGLAAANVVKIVSAAQALEYKWNKLMDEQLVLYIDDSSAKSARRLMSLTFRDIEPMSKLDQENPNYFAIKSIPVEQLRARFAVLKMLSTDYMRVLPVVDLNYSCPWSISATVGDISKLFIFQQSKMYLWRSMLGRLYSEERPQFVILNRHEAAKPRKTVQSRLTHSLFYQLYSHIGLLCDPSSLRRRGQAWMVKFVGEGGHDVGGLYNESLVDICNELQSEGSPNSVHSQLLPLFRLCPNGRHGVGENRNKYIPNSSANSPQYLRMFEFIGRLMGICCLDNNRALPLDLASFIWKCIVNEKLTLYDLKSIDQHSYNTINIIRNPSQHKVSESTFEYLFPGLYFTTENIAGQEIELLPGGGQIAVTFSNSIVYANLLQEYRLNEFNQQISAMCRGLQSIIPYEFLSIFSWAQLEVMITGSPDIDINLLREKTEYRGNLSAKDKHIMMFWEVLESFTAEDKKQFLQFVWGRNRLPANALGFGKDLFKISDHAQAITHANAQIQNNSTNANNVPAHDLFLPAAHTCTVQTLNRSILSDPIYFAPTNACLFIICAYLGFFALELPRYSNKTIMRSKILYAVKNCSTVDGDATHEGRANMMMQWNTDSD